jgi:DNA polymerase III alpha subunit
MNWGRADLLRRALVKNKDRALIENLGRELCDCARALGRSPAEIDSVWGTLREFAGYMFNKAHSAAYAVEAFAGAWLKTRYPVEFLAAVLTSRRGFYAPILYVLEALRNGARFLLPDLHLSDPARFLVQGDTIRLPLDQVKGLSQATLDRLAAGRPYESPGDFFRRARPARDEWTALLKAGVLDCFTEPRGRLFWRLQRLEAAGRASASHTLVDPVLPEAFDASPLARARWEHEILGFPVSVPPLDYFAAKVDWSRFYSIGELTRRQAEFYDREVRVCGLVVADRHHPTPQGTMKFLTLADPTGFVEVNLFSRTYQEYGHLTVRPVVAVQAAVDPFDNRRGFALTARRVFAP